MSLDGFLDFGVSTPLVIGNTSDTDHTGSFDVFEYQFELSQAVDTESYARKLVMA